jgi:hypothetical protein
MKGIKSAWPKQAPKKAAKPTCASEGCKNPAFGGSDSDGRWCVACRRELRASRRRAKASVPRSRQRI